MATREQKGNSLLSLPEDYIVLDLETTGLDPRFDCIIEIGALKVKKGIVVDTFATLVNPGVVIDNFITELTGISNEMVQDAPSIQVALPLALDFIQDKIIVGHNAHFDINFLYDLSDLILNKPFTNDFVDTLRLSRRVFPELPHHRLTDLVNHLQVGDTVAHRALSDCMDTFRCFERMRGYIQQNAIDITCHYTKPSAKNIVASNDHFDVSSPIYNQYVVFTGKLEKNATQRSNANCHGYGSTLRG